jgi:beta-glucanase (GH16 family)
MNRLFSKKGFAVLIFLVIGLVAVVGCNGNEVKGDMSKLTVSITDVDSADSLTATVKILKGGKEVGNKEGSNVQFNLAQGNYTVEVIDEAYERWTKDISIITDSILDAKLNALNLVGNGTFDQALSDAVPADGSGDLPQGSVDTEGSWIYFQGAGGSGNATIQDGAIKVDVSQNDAGYSVQLLQGPLTLTRGSKYKVQFKAKASSEMDLTVKVGGVADANWGAYLQKNESLTSEWTTYELNFTMETETNKNSRFEFWLLNPGTYYIDDVSLIKTGEVELVDEGSLTEADEDKVENWKLVKEYSFDSKADLADWRFEVGNGQAKGIPGWGNAELEYYTDGENAEIVDGKLVLTAKEEKRSDEYGTYNYTSTRMITQDKFEFTYGRVEIRAKLPEGQGIWPAIWMLGADIAENPWPDCGEIDIMELVGYEPSTVHGTIHGSGPSKGSAYTLEEGKFSDDFHEFALEWDEDEIEWYVDDTLYHVANAAEVGSTWVFDHPFFLILNIAVGGNWPGNPDASTRFPQTMEIDYIKIFEDINSESINGQEVWNSEYEDNYDGNHSSEEPNATSVKAGVIVNGSFDNEIADKLGVLGNWYVWSGEGGAVSDYGVEDGEFKIDVTALGGQTWAIQFVQNLKLDKGDYKVSFKARAEDDRDIIVMVQEDGGAWTVYGETKPTLTSDMTEYSFDVSMSRDDSPKLVFSLGKTEDGRPTTIYIDDVSIEEVN